MPALKLVEWVGASLDDLRSCPDAVHHAWHYAKKE
jgi:hypothetical protein